MNDTHSLSHENRTSNIRTEVCTDYIHVLLEILLKMSVSCFMGFLDVRESLRTGNIIILNY